MKKSDKKIENNLRKSLTDVCENALEDIDGFVWLTHRVNYASFPDSLQITCVFKANSQLATFVKSKEKHGLLEQLATALKGIDINIKSINNHVFFDSEESCDSETDGNWAKRLG
ncbi:Fis family transcriptional regulator [Thalassotalea eurytherma]|uniref:Fis family transcriptional regulator n=1 Tax=Thalassotalea eurytherma TaxID=1144278 RepID=A0ABQ6H6A3_9GAMM|nr:Fis family transcriptional regulator [Thalassotalea eurytherma]GLX83685.1 hypothetical protein theurythT_31380 [Thalassotalea eurytherma]